MNRNSAFMAAFWAGLAAPSQLYGTALRYEPYVNSLTAADSFMLVGFLVGDSIVATEHDEHSDRFSADSQQQSGRSV